METSDRPKNDIQITTGSSSTEKPADSDPSSDKETAIIAPDLETGISKPYRPTKFQSTVTIISCVSLLNSFNRPYTYPYTYT